MLKFSITTTSTNHIKYCVSANYIQSQHFARFLSLFKSFVQFDFMVHNSEYIKTNAQWYRCLSQTINKIIIFYMEVEYFILDVHYIQFVVVIFFLIFGFLSFIFFMYAKSPWKYSIDTCIRDAHKSFNCISIKSLHEIRFQFRSSYLTDQKMILCWPFLFNKSQKLRTIQINMKNGFSNVIELD